MDWWIMGLTENHYDTVSVQLDALFVCMSMQFDVYLCEAVFAHIFKCLCEFVSAVWNVWVTYKLDELPAGSDACVCVSGFSLSVCTWKHSDMQGWVCRHSVKPTDLRGTGAKC